MTSSRIILASSSPRRRKLLRQIGLTFEVIPSATDEEVAPDSVPADAAETLAFQKAVQVAEKNNLHVRESETEHVRTPVLIIGADTIVVLDGQILGKPADPADAAAMLRSLSGRTHQVYTGVALILAGDTEGTAIGSPEAASTREPFIHHVFHERTDVTFGELAGEEIAAYVDTGSPMDKAGAYGIQDDLGALFVERIEGDYYNVVGFPLFRFYREVNKLMPGIVTPFVPATGHHQT
jgi:septum formation protein